MPPKEGITFRLEADDLAVLRKVGQLSNVSADMVARRIITDMIPHLQYLLHEAEELVREEDPAGRGYLTWMFHFPVPSAHIPDEVVKSGVTVQPSGIFLSLNVDGKQFMAGEFLEVSDPGTLGTEDTPRGMWITSPRSGPSMFNNLRPLVDPVGVEE